MLAIYFKSIVYYSVFMLELCIDFCLYRYKLHYIIVTLHNCNITQIKLQLKICLAIKSMTAIGLLRITPADSLAHCKSLFSVDVQTFYNL